MGASVMRVSVVVFPGTNCDHDVFHTYSTLLKCQVQEIWHRDTDLKKPDLVVLPGGFAFGDYLRTGALARVSPIMKEVAKFAANGGPLLGVCNGFQILCEVGLLPGALLCNASRQFVSQFVHLKIENTATPFTRNFKKGEIATCPMAHFEGNYFAEAETLKKIEGEGQVVMRYSSPSGEVDPASEIWNPNGSANAIAGITNDRGNIVGFMPHPERAAESLNHYVGTRNLLGFFESSVSH